MGQQVLHSQICKNIDSLMSWYEQKVLGAAYPIYSSYDIRDAGFKVTNVDANVFPAGFNNICATDKDSAVEVFGEFFNAHYSGLKRILLVTEEHTQNPYYWDNVYTIKNLIESSGRQVLLGIPRILNEPIEVTSASGHKMQVFSAYQDSVETKNFNADLIVSNNDFSEAYVDWAKSVSLPMTPPREMGWFQRKKSNYFKFYNNLATEFCSLIDVDPFLMTVQTELFSGFDVTDEVSTKKLAEQVDAMIADLKKDYEARGINQQPFVFVKNNAGTYGLAVLRVGSGQDILELNYKSRKKMKAAKGGREVQEVIIQEGVPSVVRSDLATAEPVIYMVGCQLVGGFLRTHSQKSDQESLNAPGAIYKRLCISDLALDINSCPSENVYGWSAKLGLLAIAQEGELMGVDYKDFTKRACSK